MELKPTIIKQFTKEKLEISGAELIRSPVFPDSRGFLYEAFHILKLNSSCSVSSIKCYYPKKEGQPRTFKSHNDEFLYLVQGKLNVQLIDSNDPNLKQTLELNVGEVLMLHPGVSLVVSTNEEKTIYEIMKTTRDTTKESLLVADPRQSLPTPRPMFAIMGANGLIGSSFVREIEARGYTWCRLRSRLHQHEAIQNELLHIHPSVSVIISAGVGTRPNTRWCNDHRIETIDANVTGQLAIAQICGKLGLHLTIIGTCGFYHYDETHTLENGVGFTESDKPNNLCNFYYQMRNCLEEILNETGAIKHVLNLRALFPFNDNITSASLIGKLLGFSKINSIKSSMTVLNDLVPLALDMIRDHEVGHVNWVCEGTASNGDVIRAYKDIVDPSININEVCISQEESKKMGNSASYVVPGRLISKFGADKVPKLSDSIAKIMELIKQQKK
ncbi:dTDP-4-dehydrorhamnose reductase [Histomonas meleagridis]|uniref:dTDP-4-dehydrorhamnose reductase n=1 Tax=Histomonas meleagridis TaxID=135588 RepID=UPI00355A073D|nr:dTDP-4-dehydrorhamnose reductase [Histomonas meleagridis]KAH0801166.1 dTDP-4-dehydrorhamnose reductase [Histomonas meleagridis]